MILVAFMLAGFTVQAQKRALLIIDIQDFYFEGPNKLVNPEAAADKAALLLDEFRKRGELVVHVKHRAEKGEAINSRVAPKEGENVITKDKINSFRETGLNEYLKSNGITDLIICGMMTHMCVEGAFRAATDLGYSCTVVEDACATRDLTFGGVTIPAKEVHYSTLASLTYYGKIVTLSEFLKKGRN